jgi:hypothetical protein
LSDSRKNNLRRFDAVKQLFSRDANSAGELMRIWLFGAWLGRNAVGAVTFDADTAQDAAKDGQADAGDEIQDGVGKVPGEVRVQEDRNASVDEHGEDIAESASRHGVLLAREDGEA